MKSAGACTSLARLAQRAIRFSRVRPSHKFQRTQTGPLLWAAVAIVPILALALLLLPLPCADDLLVEMGAAADQCAGLSSQQHQDSPAHSVSICLCACHVGIATGPVLAQLPDLERGALRAPLNETVLEPVSSAITHPPLG